ADLRQHAAGEPQQRPPLGAGGIVLHVAVARIEDRRHHLPVSRVPRPTRVEGAPNNSATQRLASCCSQIVSTAITIGTPIRAPAMPHSQVQKNTAHSTRNGDIDSALPATLGSR